MPPDRLAVEPSYAADATGQGEALLAHNHDKSGRPENGCPTPREDRAFVLDSGEVIPIPCGRNGCPVCRRRNVQVTAAMMGINAARSPTPPTYAVLSTTREWIDDATLREGWAQFARRVRKDVHAECGYAWFREWTTGKADGIRRTHYHSVWDHLDNDDQAQAVKEISLDVWARLAGAYSEKAHGWKRVWDAGGLTRYIAGLVGHHLKDGQAPPPGWAGRRYGTSRGFYVDDARQLRREAMVAVRDDRLRHHLELTMGDELNVPDGLPEDIWDELLTQRLDQHRDRPPPRIIRIRPGFWA
jgi:hypothetical protein